MTCSGMAVSIACMNSTNLSPHLRLKHIEDRNEGADLIDVLTEVSLHPVLRPRLKQCRRPHLPTRRLPRHTAGRTPGEEESPGTWPRTSSRSPPPRPPAIFRPREVWCNFSARAIATLRRSWRRNCLSRRCRRLMAAEGALSTSIMTSTA